MSITFVQYLIKNTWETQDIKKSKEINKQRILYSQENKKQYRWYIVDPIGNIKIDLHEKMMYYKRQKYPVRFVNQLIGSITKTNTIKTNHLKTIIYYNYPTKYLSAFKPNTKVTFEVTKYNKQYIAFNIREISVHKKVCFD